MAMTLTQYGYLSTDVLKKGIIQTILYDCPILDRMPFIDIVGNSLLYNLESTAAGADFYAVGDVWKESTPTVEQRSVALTILGGDADVDSFIEKTRSNVQDVEAAIIELKAKAIAQKFAKELFFGGTGSVSAATANGFKGITQLIAECESSTTTDLDHANNSQVINGGSAADTAQALSLLALDKLIDAIKPGKPDALMMSKGARRKLTSLCRVAGGSLDYTNKTTWGQQLEGYNGIPIFVNDWIPDTVDATSSSALDVSAASWVLGSSCSPIFALKFGENGFCGLQNGGIDTETIGKLETKDARRTRIKWYCSVALFSIRAAAVLLNVTV